MELNAFINWLHLLAVVVWIGGTVYQLAIHMPAATREVHGFPDGTFTESALHFRWVVVASILLSMLSGIMRVSTLGGMAAVPPIIHTKLLIVVLMYGLGLFSAFYLAPKLHVGVATLEDLNEAEKASLKQTFSQYVNAQGFVVLMGFGIFLMLSMAGLV